MSGIAHPPFKYPTEFSVHLGPQQILSEGGEEDRGGCWADDIMSKCLGHIRRSPVFGTKDRS